MARELTLDELVRGTRVAWEWSGVAAGIAAEKRVRPVGRVVTHEDLPSMSKAIEVGIQVDDDLVWVMDPRQMIAKGRKIYSVDEVAG